MSINRERAQEIVNQYLKRAEDKMNAPGVLLHVMIRGIERSKIFRNNKDCEDYRNLAQLFFAEALI